MKGLGLYCLGLLLVEEIYRLENSSTTRSRTGRVGLLLAVGWGEKLDHLGKIKRKDRFQIAMFLIMSSISFLHEGPGFTATLYMDLVEYHRIRKKEPTDNIIVQRMRGAEGITNWAEAWSRSGDSQGTLGAGRGPGPNPTCYIRLAGPFPSFRKHSSATNNTSTTYQ